MFGIGSDTHLQVFSHDQMNGILPQLQELEQSRGATSHDPERTAVDLQEVIKKRLFEVVPKVRAEHCKSRTLPALLASSLCLLRCPLALALALILILTPMHNSSGGFPHAHAQFSSFAFSGRR